MKPPRVCYLGAYDPAYPRNLILRRGLATQGVEVIECRAPRELSTAGRARALLRRFPTLAGRCDVILLAEFGQSLAPVAWWLARRFHRRLIIDAFTPIYDSAVYDRRVTSPRSLAARRYRLIDWLALRLADRVLVDTDQHRAYFVQEFGARRDRLHVIPVGASREWFEAPPAPHEEDGTLVQFYGSYIPLHGMDVILRAAHALRGRGDIHFELIGRGQTYQEMRALSERLGLENVRFRDPVPPDDLPALAARAEISLGIFGMTPKAGRVIPNKVYQTLALGKPLITADTPALREAFTPGEHLLAVPPGDPDALAGSIARLADDAALRSRIAEAGRARMEAAFTEAALGRLLLEVIS